MAFLETPQKKFFVQADVTPAPSVLMTPSSSCGRAVSIRVGPPRAMIPPPPFSLPITPPPAKLEEHTDILGGLYECGFPSITEQILSLLDKDDMTRCLRVSHTWHKLVKESSCWTPPPEQPVAMITLDENNNRLPRSELKPYTEVRQPLKIIANTRKEEVPKTYQLPMKRARLTMTPCPQCPSPAKVLSNRRAECISCSFEFCQKCLMPWHENDSCGRQNISTSPKKKNILIACAKSKKSKKNLRRL